MDVLTNSALPVLRKLGVSKEGRELFKNENSLSMMKVWLALELRQFVNALVQDVSMITRRGPNTTNSLDPPISQSRYVEPKHLKFSTSITLYKQYISTFSLHRLFMVTFVEVWKARHTGPRGEIKLRTTSPHIIPAHRL